jgi:hypothetical protein
MLSSAGVTRPEWSEDKKQRLEGAADIPIIRLNPADVLGKKRAAETRLRQSGLPYAIVRPTGLKDSWPAGRPIFSQGDVAVGRSAPADVANVLVGLLDQPDAVGKTFEMLTLTGYPPARSLAPALRRLMSDKDGPLSPAAVEASYALLQQALPGEEQDATQLEMGRSYEAVDRGEVAPRERGAAPTERERKIAESL